MFPRSVVLFAAAVLAIPAVGLAQNEDEDTTQPSADVVQVASWKCDITAIGQIIEISRDDLTPIAQEVIDAGHWQYFQLLVHSWGDEWNVQFYTRATSMDDFFEGWSQYILAVGDRHPEQLEWFFSVCSEHKDNFYVSVVSAGT